MLVPKRPSAFVCLEVKGGHISLSELVDQCLVRSCNVLENPYSGDAYAIVVKEAEQFLWAGFEVDPVPEKVKRFIIAQKWAEGIRDCASKVKKWSSHFSCDFKRVDIKHAISLLNFDVVPCNEPGYLELKELAEEAKLLIQEIESVSELELLYSRTSDFPIYLKESEKLLQKISSAKAWMDCARKCISKNGDAVVDIDMLNKLKSEIPKLQVELLEEEMLLSLVRQAESYGSNLRIQVDEKLSLIEVELKKACCRQKALKAWDSKMSLDFVQQVIVDSTVCFVLGGKSSQSSGKASSYHRICSCSPHKLQRLKELTMQSKSLKITLEERRMLDMVLRQCEMWKHIACYALKDAVHILGTSCVTDGVNDSLTSRI
ncbi:transcription factor jumonji (jmjC) domain-containing protein [Euphorbia peplus]|nr:transcription factor jumonji (jmjC) domain-containing protein [Euphorbia peplus]